jgi:histidinol-phosphatase (PHP family)
VLERSSPACLSAQVLACDYHTHPQGHQIRPYTLELLQPWIDQARAKQVQSIAFTDHDRYHQGIDFDVLERLRERNPDMHILAGIELDNDPVTSAAGLAWVEKHWNRLDFVLGSVHYLPGETAMFDSADQSHQLQSRGITKAFEQYLQELETLIARASIDCLAHIDLAKIHGLRPEFYDPGAWFRPVLELASKANLAIEASTAGWRKAVKEQYPHEAILRLAKELSIPVTTASDAHSHFQVAEDYERLEPLLDRAGITEAARFVKHSAL